ncbi:DUF6438 domain-containing protein [Flagellimonas flava]|nr:DUF6438 domain-containing protein [Allomuricauda flava]
MKKVIMIMTLVLFSCRTNEKVMGQEMANETLVSYSKGPCLGGRCPVYRLEVYVNGTYYLKKSKGAYSQRELEGKLSDDELKVLNQVLASIPSEVAPFKRIRDVPVTGLTYQGKKHRYHASRIEGPLHTINSRMEELVSTIHAR